MAAMIDVVFLLLVFFMCTSSFRKPEEDLPSQLPEVGAAQDQRQMEEELGTIRIDLQRLGDGVLVLCDGRPCATFDALAARLRSYREVGGDRPVIIQGQGSVPFGYMVAAMDACYRQDLWRVAFSAKGLNE